MKVSVIMPAYKAKFIKEAINSVLNQTFTDFELIVVNDKSPEDIGSIVNSFTDSRIRYYKNEDNLGGVNLVDSWNKCLSYAEGDYVCLLCDDDIYHPDFLKTMVHMAKNNPDVDVFKARARFVDAAGNTIGLYPSSPSFEIMEDYMWHCLKNLRAQTISEIFWKRSRLLEVGGFYKLPLAWYSDYMSVFVCCQKNGIVSTTDILVDFRLSGLNITSQTSKGAKLKIKAAGLFANAIKQMVKEQNFIYPKLVLDACSEKIKYDYSILLSNCSPIFLLYIVFNYKKMQIPKNAVVRGIYLFLKHKFNK